MESEASGPCIRKHLLEVILLLFVSVPFTSTLLVPDCSIVMETLQISEEGVGYFRSNSRKVDIMVRLIGTAQCKLFYNYIHIDEPLFPELITLSTNTSELIPASLDMFDSKGVSNGPWYEITFDICDGLVLRIGSKVKEFPLNRTSYASLKKAHSLLEKDPLSDEKSILQACYPDPISFSIKGADLMCPWSYSPSGSTKVERNCSEIVSLPPLHTNTPFLTHPTSILDRDTYQYSGKREESAIPIFIGVLAFTLSMCMRFCLCRGRSVVQRVTTVTVIRSRPTSENNSQEAALDPPPAYVDVVSETITPEAPQEPPPPSYNEINPPPYYEVEDAGVALPEREAGHYHSNQSLNPITGDHESSQNLLGASSTSFTRAMQSITLKPQKQFSFKPLKEDEE